MNREKELLRHKGCTMDELVKQITEQIFEAISKERCRQDKMYGKYRTNKPAYWLPILIEEVGEVSIEIMNMENNERLAVANYIDELVQVAAVAVAAITATVLPQNSSTGGLNK